MTPDEAQAKIKVVLDAERQKNGVVDKFIKTATSWGAKPILFGGVCRRVVWNQLGEKHDWDIPLMNVAPSEFNEIIKSLNISRDHTYGYTLTDEDQPSTSVDTWRLNETWAICNDIKRPSDNNVEWIYGKTVDSSSVGKFAFYGTHLETDYTIDDLVNSVYFDCDAIAYDIIEDKLYYNNGYFDRADNKIIGLLNNMQRSEATVMARYLHHMMYTQNVQFTEELTSDIRKKLYKPEASIPNYNWVRFAAEPVMYSYKHKYGVEFSVDHMEWLLGRI